jgi:hypothetical protein
MITEAVILKSGNPTTRYLTFLEMEKTFFPKNRLMPTTKKKVQRPKKQIDADYKKESTKKIRGNSKAVPDENFRNKSAKGTQEILHLDIVCQQHSITKLILVFSPGKKIRGKRYKKKKCEE